MRQAVGETDDWMHYRVEIDGRPIDYVIEADEEAGYVIIDDPNLWMLNQPSQRRVEGRVRLIDLRIEGEGRVESLGGAVCP